MTGGKLMEVMADPAIRDELLARVVDALREDGRIVAAVLVGSGAFGFRDEEADLDLVAAVGMGHDAAAVYQDWAARVGEVLPVVYLAWPPGPFQRAHRLHNALLDAGGALLELDLSFAPLSDLRATREHWRVLFDRTGEAQERMAVPLPPLPPLEESLPLVSAACHRVLECRKALRRGRLWQAALVLHELQELTLHIAVQSRFDDERRRTNHQRLVDDLPTALLEEVAGTFAPAEREALAAALRRATRVMLSEARALYRRTGDPFPNQFARMLSAQVADLDQRTPPSEALRTSTSR